MGGGGKGAQIASFLSTDSGCLGDKDLGARWTGCPSTCAQFLGMVGAVRGSFGHVPGVERSKLCCAARMDQHDQLIRLHAMRGLLETRLLVLERAIEERQQSGMAAPDLADRVTGLLDRLGQVNAKLAELRGPVAPA